MEEYSDFRKEIGLKGIEIEKLTGYSKQGLHYAFEMIKEGKPLSRKFLICINAAIEAKMKTETEQYEQKIWRLKNLQEKFLRLKEG